MKKYILTWPGIAGHCTLIYDENGTLAKVDVSQCEFTVDSIEKLLSQLSARVGNIKSKLPEVTNIQVQEIEVTFEIFWRRYGKKINRLRAVKLWDKLSTSDMLRAYNGITRYNKYLKQEGWRGKADPETYLRNRSWENEY